MENINIFEQKFNISRLIKFSIPSIIMMFVLSMYQCVDGLFVSNFVNTNAIGAINIVYPFIFIGLGISLMLGTGGSALIGKALGEGDKDKANSLFTFLIFRITFSVGHQSKLNLIGWVFLLLKIKIKKSCDSQLFVLKIIVFEIFFDCQINLLFIFKLHQKLLFQNNLKSWQLFSSQNIVSFF